jgi:hypothetical protein
MFRGLAATAAGIAKGGPGAHPAGLATPHLDPGNGAPPGALTGRRIFDLWLPLAASWLFMGVELPLFTACVARMPDSEVQLAAFGALVFPVSLVIEAPIIMLLAASTALSSDWASYVKLRHFMHLACACLTAVHAAVAFTPLFSVVARDVLGVPPEVQGPARIGLMLMTPWTWSIGYRRFHQGVLIRHDHARAVGLGTAVRLAANALVLLLGYHLGGAPGIVVGTAGIICGVIAEAAFIGWAVQPVLRERVLPAPPAAEPLSRQRFLGFYWPLALTPLVTFLVHPLGSAAMSRMPGALASLAAWPAVHGFLFIPRGVGMALNEVVVALLPEPGASRALWRFTLQLALVLIVLTALFALSPLSASWFGTLSGLTPELARISVVAVLCALPLPACSTLQSWYQGVLVHERRTRGVTEAVVLCLLTAALALALGVAWQGLTGIYLAQGALALGGLVQTAWLWWRCRGPAVKRNPVGVGT